MKRSLTLLIAVTGVLAGSGAFAQSTTTDPLGIKVIDEPTLTQQRGAIGQTTHSSIPRNNRSYWSSGTLNDLNLDGEIDQ